MWDNMVEWRSELNQGYHIVKKTKSEVLEQEQIIGLFTSTSQEDGFLTFTAQYFQTCFYIYGYQYD